MRLDQVPDEMQEEYQQSFEVWENIPNFYFNNKVDVKVEGGKTIKAPNGQFTSSLEVDAAGKKLEKPFQAPELKIIVLHGRRDQREYAVEVPGTEGKDRSTQVVCRSEDGKTGSVYGLCKTCRFSQKEGTKSSLCKRVGHLIVLDNLTMQPHRIKKTGGSAFDLLAIIQEIARYSKEENLAPFAKAFKIRLQEYTTGLAQGFYKLIVERNAEKKIVTYPLPENIQEQALEQAIKTKKFIRRDSSAFAVLPEGTPVGTPVNDESPTALAPLVEDTAKF